MSKPAKVLLIEDTTEYAELVDDWLCGEDSDGSFVLMWTDSLAAGLKKLETETPDVILLDLTLPDSKTSDTFSQIREAASTIPIIVLSAGKSEALALTMIGQGAADYLVKSTCTADGLIRSVRYAMIRQLQAEKPAEGERNQNRFIGVMGARGGVGTTTMAWSLAIDLARQTGEKVLVCDLDSDSGLLSFFAGIEPEHTMRDAVDNLARLDQACFDKIVSHAPQGVDVLASPVLHGSKELDLAGVERVLARARGFYKWTIVDFSRPTATALRLAAPADEIVLVTSTGIPSLYETKRFIASLDATQRGRFRLLVNEINSSQRLSQEELGNTFGVPVLAVLPHDGELYKASLEQRLPNDASAFRKQIVRLARKVAGLSELKPKRGMASFFRTREESSVS